MHFFAIYRKTVTALYAYEIRQNAGGLVCTLFGGCGLVPGVRLVYALFKKEEKKYKKEGKKGAVKICTLWKKTGRPSVCTLWREKRSPAAGIASRREERVPG